MSKEAIIYKYSNPPEVYRRAKKYLGKYYSRPVIVSKEHELSGTTMDKLFVDKEATKTDVDFL